MKAWIDVGGTFTDCFVVDPRGKRRHLKVLSSGVTKTLCASASSASEIAIQDTGCTVHDFWRDFELVWLNADGSEKSRRRVVAFDADQHHCRLDQPFDSAPSVGEPMELHSDLLAPVLAVRRLLQIPRSVPLPKMEVRMGTTRGTNALLTRTGPSVGLVVTSGFKDLLRIGSQERPDLFALHVVKPRPLTEDVIEVAERIDADGNVLIPLDEEATRAELQRLYERGTQSISISLLHSYRNDAHERAIENLAREIGFQEISRSSDVAPLIKLLSRAETSTLDAYLNPVLVAYLDRVLTQFGGPQRAKLRLMTSGGQLVDSTQFRGRDSVLSGPAGGVVALAAIGETLRQHKTIEQGVIGFDMGGTSTDVSRWEGEIPRRFESRKAGVRILTPTLSIHTVAAGGGSICRVDGGRMLVGPESAGAAPGPACYGRGGPLAVTDLNLILGRIDAEQFPFPLEELPVRRALTDAWKTLGEGSNLDSLEAVAEGFWKIAVNHMAEAVRTVSSAEGTDPRELALVCFGGAAGQHACGVAETLGMRRIVDHPESSMLSALGMGLASIGRHTERGIYQLVHTIPTPQLENWMDEIGGQARSALEKEAGKSIPIMLTVSGELRYEGTEQTIELPLLPLATLSDRFHAGHQRHFGYQRPQRSIELVTLRADAQVPPTDQIEIAPTKNRTTATSTASQPIFIAGEWVSTNKYDRATLQPGDRIVGPAIIAGTTSTLVLHENWMADVSSDGTIVAELVRSADSSMIRQTDHESAAVIHEILARRLSGIAEQMGEVLRRTSVSVNVKERLDYSCAVFRQDGTLVAGAMHVPVHLGAMGHTVRAIRAQYPTMFAGDVYLSNNPYAGGSHLPDVTVVTPVFVGSSSGQPDFFVASRAHHAEIGGQSPGSMPTGATCLADEGVVIENFALVREGECFDQDLRDLLSASRWPSRSPEENIADIAAQVAAGERGARDVRALALSMGTGSLDASMSELLEMTASSLDDVFAMLGSSKRSFIDTLIPGSQIAVSVQVVNDRLQVDFSGTSAVHPRGWNATPAIVSAAVLYVLRCMANRPLPMSEAALRRVDIHIPEGLLHPSPGTSPENSPAVVAGNVETSQRVVDCLLQALQLSACSQGTMNNLLIGNTTFGYYETICGGAGATAEGPGADAVHTHMTNTRITDAEVVETRYPLRLWQFAIRKGSGGEGDFCGGNGVVREFEALEPLTISLLTSRRTPPGPPGMFGAGAGACGANFLKRRDAEWEKLPAITQVELQPGDRLRIETPGGGGYNIPRT